MASNPDADTGVRAFQHGGLRLLSLDGGGVRGLSSLIILEEIMNQVNAARQEKGLGKQKPSEVFDLIGGTSTGGLIAIMLGRLNMTATACREKYVDLMTEVFRQSKHSLPVNLMLRTQARFSSEGLKNAILKVIASELFPDRGVEGIKDAEKAKFLCTDDESRCKVFVCATTAETKRTRRIRAYTVGGVTDHLLNPTIWQAALATTAATTFFDEVKIGSQRFVDGGFTANNPWLEVEREAQELWLSGDEQRLQEHVKSFVSIGTGVPKTEGFGRSLGSFVKAAVDLATDADKKARDFQSQWKAPYQNGRAFRFNVPQGLEDIRLDKFKLEGNIIAATCDYIDDVANEQALKACVRSLIEDVRVPRYMIPYQISEFQRNLQCTIERRSLLRDIEKYLHSSPQDRRILILHGIAGCGKSELADAYVRNSMEAQKKTRYTAAFKLYARSSKEFSGSIIHIAQRIFQETHQPHLGLGVNPGASSIDTQEADVERVLNWFNQPENRQWVIVIDSLDSIDGLECRAMSFLRRLNHGHILITSQSSRLGGNLNFNRKIDVSRLEGEECLELIDGILGATSGEQPSMKSNPTVTYLISEEKSDIEDLCNELKNHALAIACAASYMEHFRINASEYLKKWRNCDVKIFLKNRKLLSTTFTLAYERLSPECQNFLGLCSFLDSSNISYTLFDSDSSVETVKSITSERAVVEDLIEELRALSLLSSNQGIASGDGADIHIHPAIQKFVHFQIWNPERRLLLGNEEYRSTQLEKPRAFIAFALRIVANAIPRQDDQDRARKMSRLWYHAEECHNNLKELKRYPCNVYQSFGPEIFLDIGDIGKIFHEAGQVARASEYYDEAIQWLKHREHRVDRARYLELVNGQGLAALARRNYAAARECFGRVLNDRMSTGLPILQVKTNLALALLGDRHLDKAVQDFKEVLEQYALEERDQQIKNPVNIARVKQFLAVTHLYRNEGDSALSQISEARTILLQHFTKETSFSLQCCQILARIHLHRNEHEEALKQIRHAQSGFNEILGPKHASSLLNHSKLLFVKGAVIKKELYRTNYKDERESPEGKHLSNEYNTLLENMEKVFGYDNVATMQTRYEYGDFLRSTSQLVQAEQNLVRVLTLYKARPDEDKRSQMFTAYALGKCYTRSTKFDQAIDTLNHASKFFWDLRFSVDKEIVIDLFKTRANCGWNSVTTSVIVKESCYQDLLDLDTDLQCLSSSEREKYVQRMKSLKPGDAQ